MKNWLANRVSVIQHADILIGLGCMVMLASGMLGWGLDWTPENPKKIEKKAAAPVVRVFPEPGAIEIAQGMLENLLWAPDPAEQAWERMTADMSALASQHRGRVAIYLKDLNNGKTWTYHSNDLFPSASLIKVPVMAAVFYKINDGTLRLSDRIRLKRRHKVGGSGKIRYMRTGSRMSVKTLLYKMINDSDNTATAMLIDTVGMDYIQRHMPSMGLFYTEIYKDGMSLRGGRVKRENYTTAKEIATIMEKIYRGELVDKYSDELMFDILKHRRKSRGRLAKGMPAGWTIAHKTGLLRQACHDSAIYMTPNGDYLLTVMTGENPSYRSAKTFISKIGKIAFSHHRGDGYFAKSSNKKIASR